MLGGTHGINAMIYLRGHRRDYDEWERFNPTWGYDNVLKYFKKSERNLNMDYVDYENGKYHSDSGMLNVGKYRLENETHPIEERFILAGKEVGYKFIHDFNSDNTLGYSRVQGTVFNGRRQTTAKAFLVPAKDRDNLHIIKYAHVKKIELTENKQASSLIFSYKENQTFTVKMRKEIVVSAGAISTPQILMLSGIGPAADLQSIGIKLIHDLSGVGKNLEDHLIIPMFFSFHRSLANSLKTDNILQNTIDLYLHNKGPFTNLGITDLVGYINTVNGSGYPDIETHHFAYSIKSNALKTYLNIVGYDDTVQNTLFKENKDAEIAMVFVVLLNPKSNGFIKLKSTDPIEKPFIFANYLHENEDWNTILNGVKYQYNQVNSNAFKSHDGSFIRLPFKECDNFKLPSDEYFKCYIDQMATTVYHPTGTCKMGPKSEKHAVVDARLKVHGVSNLRIIDASIMPHIVSSNTNAPTIMIAEKGSDMIKEDYNVARDEL